MATSNIFRLQARRTRRDQMSGFGDATSTATAMENVTEAFKRALLDLRVHVAGLANATEIQKIAASVGASTKAEVMAKLDSYRSEAGRLEGELYDRVMSGNLALRDWLEAAQYVADGLAAIARSYGNSPVAGLVTGQMSQARSDLENIERQVRIAPPPTTLVQTAQRGPGTSAASAAADTINIESTVASAPDANVVVEKPFPYLLVGGAVAAGALLFALS